MLHALIIGQPVIDIDPSGKLAYGRWQGLECVARPVGSAWMQYWGHGMYENQYIKRMAGGGSRNSAGTSHSTLHSKTVGSTRRISSITYTQLSNLTCQVRATIRTGGLYGPSPLQTPNHREVDLRRLEMKRPYYYSLALGICCQYLY